MTQFTFKSPHYSTDEIYPVMGDLEQAVEVIALKKLPFFEDGKNKVYRFNYDEIKQVLEYFSQEGMTTFYSATGKIILDEKSDSQERPYIAEVVLTDTESGSTPKTHKYYIGLGEKVRPDSKGVNLVDIIDIEEFRKKNKNVQEGKGTYMPDSIVIWAEHKTPEEYDYVAQLDIEDIRRGIMASMLYWFYGNIAKL